MTPVQNYDGLEKTCETGRAASRVSETASLAQASLRNGGRASRNNTRRRISIGVARCSGGGFSGDRGLVRDRPVVVGLDVL